MPLLNTIKNHKNNEAKLLNINTVDNLRVLTSLVARFYLPLALTTACTMYKTVRRGTTSYIPSCFEAGQLFAGVMLLKAIVTSTYVNQGVRV